MSASNSLKRFPRDDFQQVLEHVRAHRDWRWARANFKDVVQRAIVASGAKRVMEIGGGRLPLFLREEIEKLGVEYTSNDVSQRELDRSPSYVSKACFDVSTKNQSEIAPFENRYDFVFSQMVFEHIRDNRQAYANVFRILGPDGICLNFHPLQYTVPFMVNRALPDSLSRRLVTKMFPNRTDDGIPKFPAYYNNCFITKRAQQLIEDSGFSHVEFCPFYGHGYFDKIPGARNLARLAHDFANRSDMKILASFAYVFAQKGESAA